MTMKHISKTLPTFGKGKGVKKATRPTPTLSKPKKIGRPIKIRSRRIQHPMQWFFDNERKELARREKLKEKGKYKDKGGRPPIIDEFIVMKLEQAFSVDATVEEACTYAGISRNTLHQFIKKVPEFQDRIDMLKELPMMVARETITRSMGHDADLALKYAKNKRNNEFNERKEVKMGGSLKLLPKLDNDEAGKIKNTFQIFLGAVDAVAEDVDDEDDNH